MHSFCTLFDSNYLSRGLAMYESLYKYMEDFHLYIFSFDERCHEILTKMKLDRVTVISQKEFETEELLRVKEERTRGEYCWTCTPSVIYHVLEKYNTEDCTYLDADLRFYSSPQILFDELGDDSVMITEHRFTKKYESMNINGKYCVQFMTFKNDEYGLKVLKWWRDACIEWCYSRIEGNKFGDQKYLDDWTERFEKVHELQYLGGGVAPWNVQQYDFQQKGDKVVGVEKESGRQFNLVFFHFHGLRIYKEGYIKSVYFDLSKQIMEFIYGSYFEHIQGAKAKIGKYDDSFDPHGSTESDDNYLELKKLIAKLEKGNYNYDNILIVDKEAFEQFKQRTFSLFSLMVNIFSKVTAKVGNKFKRLLLSK